ncbi:zinc finger, CCHC-type containing protein [Tanacetum coccineum]
MEAQTAFEKLKSVMTQTPVLQLPDFNEIFIIEADASGIGIGAVLQQNGHPIAFLSKTLAPKHQVLSTYEKEFLAVIQALEKWRGYLLDRHFVIKMIISVFICSFKGEKIDEHVEVEKDDQEEAEMKRHIEILKDDEVAIDAIPLATKPPVIVEYKIDKYGRMGYFKLIRADRSLKMYSSMIKMLQGIDREDLETLWKLVKAKHMNTRPEEDYERVLWGDLKVMFEPDIKSEVWRNLQGYKVTV